MRGCGAESAGGRGARSPQRRGWPGAAEGAGGVDRGRGLGRRPSGRYRETKRSPAQDRARAATALGLQAFETKVNPVSKKGGGTAERAGTPFPSPANRRWPGLGFGARLLASVTAQTEMTYSSSVPSLLAPPPGPPQAPPLVLLLPPPASSEPKPQKVSSVGGAVRSPQGLTQWLSGKGF